MTGVGPPRVFVISGPSGAGKGTLIDALLPRFGGLALAISATTRAVRPGEVDGEDYYFLSQETFDARVRAGDFLEYVTYAGNSYGTLRDEVERILGEGCSVIVEIELRGARAIRSMLPSAVAIFIAPPSPEALADRLRRRGKDSEAAIARRMEESVAELAAQGEFDHVVTNDDAERAADALEALVSRYLHGTD